MPKLTIVAKIKAFSGAEEKVRQELLKLIDATIIEDGCIEYTLHRSIEDSSVFLFYETWENRELWLSHMAAKHIGVYNRNTYGLVESFDLYELAKENE